MIKIILTLIPFAIFCLLGGYFWAKQSIDEQYEEIKKELNKEQNNKKTIKE